MRFGVALPTAYEGLIYPPPFGSRDAITRIALEAERLEYDSVMPNDHFATQRYVRELVPSPPNYYDPFVSLAYVAAQTSRIRLITGVAVLPLRDPASLAKAAATLDQLSGGRLVLGVGIGAYREEYTSVRPERKSIGRGELLEEGIRALQVLFEDDVSSFDGRFWQFTDVQMYPKPLQSPLPILIGGNADIHLERAASHCQGWLPAVMSPDELAARVGRLREAAERHGRRLDEFEIAPQLTVSMAASREAALERFRGSHAYRHLVSLQRSTLKGQQGGYETRNLIGTADEIAARVEEYATAGATSLPGLIFAVDTVDEFIDQMQAFRADVVTRVNGS